MASVPTENRQNPLRISENLEDQNSVTRSTKCTSAKQYQVGATNSSNVREGTLSLKETSIGKPIICSCCRKRSEAEKLNKSVEVLQLRKECNAGDTLDTASIKNCEFEFTALKKNGVYKSGQQENRLHEKKINSQHSCQTEKQSCRPEEEHDSTVKDCKENYRCSPTKLDSFCSRRDECLKRSTPCSRDLYSLKHSSLDLLRSRQDHNRGQYDRYHHCQDCCHRRYSHRECYSRPWKEKAGRTSDTCLCFTHCCHKTYDTKVRGARNPVRTHETCYSKDSAKISHVQEHNGEERDDCVGVINHKDSLCILVEKYKSNKADAHKDATGKVEALAAGRNSDECNKSLTSEISCQLDANENVRDTDRRGKSSVNDIRGRFRYCVTPIEKVCKHGQACRKLDGNTFENLRSRSANGTCCSTKNTDWRHTV